MAMAISDNAMATTMAASPMRLSWSVGAVEKTKNCRVLLKSKKALLGTTTIDLTELANIKTLFR
jgi:hypothetical protein